MRLNSDLLLIALLVISLFGPCCGQKIYEFSYNKDLPVLASSFSLTLGSEIIERTKKPISEEFVNNLNRSRVIKFDRSTLNNYSTKSGNHSDIFKNMAFVAPFSLMASKQGRENFKEILGMYSEVILLNGSLTYFTKALVGRVRPYAYNPEVDLSKKLQRTTRRSFFSGHVSHVSSLSFFTAKVFNDLYPDSNYKYLVWGGAAAIPALTGYLRYKSGAHFPSDVIIGYGVGAAVGIFIPSLHKIKVKKSDSYFSFNGNSVGFFCSLNK